MQRGVAKHRVELAGEGKPLAVNDPRVESARAGRLDEVRARIDADDRAAQGNELFRERAVAAAEIEDAFARLWRKQRNDRRAEIGDEPGVASVALRVPRLLGVRNLGFSGGSGC
jgi:hypothetical protein